MTTLNLTIKALTDIAKAHANTRAATRAAGNYTEIAVFNAMEKEQEAELTTVTGDKVLVIVREATGNCASHFRVTYKLNGKRAKAADIAGLEFAAPAAAEPEVIAVVKAEEFVAVEANVAEQVAELVVAELVEAGIEHKAVEAITVNDCTSIVVECTGSDAKGIWLAVHFVENRYSGYTALQSLEGAQKCAKDFTEAAGSQKAGLKRR